MKATGVAPFSLKTDGRLLGLALTVPVVLAMNAIAAILFPAAADDQAFKVGGFRFVDLLSVASLFVVVLLCAATRARPARRPTIIVFGVLLLWGIWTALPAIGLTSVPLDTRSLFAEWQPAIYLASCWFVIGRLNRDVLWRLIRLIVLTQAPIILFAALAAGAGVVQSSSDLASIACVNALLACTLDRNPGLKVLLILAALWLAFSAEQRASLLSCVPALLFVALVFSWQRLVKSVTARFLVSALIGLAFVSLLLSGVLPHVLSDSDTWASNLFARDAKVDSADSRVIQWSTALAILSTTWALGNGIGVTYRFYDPGVDQDLTSNITHNSVLDLALRFGAPITAGIVIGMAALIIGLLLASHKHRQRAQWIIAVALATLLIKGGVESILFKPRVAYLLAVVLALGLALIFDRASRVPGTSDRGRTALE